MIRVVYSVHTDEVEADKAHMLGEAGVESTLLVLTKEGKEVAWYRYWDSAVVMDNLKVSSRD